MADLILSEKYKAFLRCTAPVEFLEGTTAAGKTTVGLFKFILRCAESEKRIHVLSGLDQGTIEKNIITKELGILDDFGGLVEYWPSGRGDDRMAHLILHTTDEDKKIYVLGYADKARWKKALGGQYGCLYIQVQNSNKENATAQIDTVQPEIRYDAFVESYAATLNMCLQGIVSPATLGIDVGKMSSAEAQREKKDITGMTRNAITDALEKVLPQVVCSMLMTYDLMHSNQAGAYEPKVTFGEYGAPDFDSRVQTIASAATASVMSVEAQVDELWGASKDDDWKRAEVQRILTERGIEDTPEPGIVESLPAGQDTDIPGNDAV